MNCLDYRRAVGADPGAQTPALHAHAADCEACDRYRDELKHFDQRIYRALSIAVRAQSERLPVPQSRLTRWASAIVVAASLLALLLSLSARRESFAYQLAEHVEGEPHALIRGDAVETHQLDSVLASSGIRRKRDMGTVSFAMNCWFQGRYVPHLVVQGDGGPVTVLVLTEELRVARREAFNEREFQGVVLAAPRGVVAVVAQNAQVEKVAERFLQAVEYQL